MLFSPIIAPAPIICPKLVVAINSGNPNPSKPKIGIDGPKLLVFIEYLPIAIAVKLDISIMIAALIDHIDDWNANIKFEFI